MIVKLMLFASLLILNFSCKKYFKDEEFTLTKNLYTGDELKIDGYYYYNSSYEDSEDASVLVFYENGIALNAGGGYTKIEFEEMFENGSFYQAVKDNPNVWGLFKIEVNEIQIEHLYPQGNIKSDMFKQVGKILDDSTFHLTKFMHSYGSEQEAINDTFHYRKFTYKPDSLNGFLK